MKPIIISLVITAFAVGAAAQNAVVSPLKNAITDSLCRCLTAVDSSTIKTKEDATNVITTCFNKQSDLLMKLAEERKINISNNAAMRDLGIEVGKNLLTQGCSSFIQLSVKLAQNNIEREANLDEGTTEGTLKRVDVKHFEYLVIADHLGNERS